MNPFLIVQAQANLPYVDDSEAVSPISEENNVHGCLADSLSGMATVAGQVSHQPNVWFRDLDKLNLIWCFDFMLEPFLLL